MPAAVSPDLGMTLDSILSIFRTFWLSLELQHWLALQNRGDHNTITTMSVRTCSKRFGALLRQQHCTVHQAKRRCYASTATAGSSLPQDYKQAIEVPYLAYANQHISC